MLKAVIFDIDGVLIDSFDSNVTFFQRIAKYLGYRPPTRKEYIKLFPLPAIEIISHITKIKDRDKLEKMLNGSFNAIDQPIYLFKAPKGSKWVIKKLAKNYKLALVTSRVKKGVKNYFDFSGQKKYFDVVVHFEHYKNPKPHPEPLRVALRRLNIGPSEAIYVGDAHSDVLAAHAAKMRVIAYGKKKLKGADFHAQNFKQIYSIIQKL